MELEIWHIWILIAILFFILEIVIPSFVVFNFGIGSVIASIADGINLSIEWQLLFFSIGTISSFFLIRPLVRKWAYRRSDPVETNVNAMIGRTGIVSEIIDISKNSGRVKLDGDDWKAISNDQSVIETGKTVRIIEVESIVVKVEKVN